jgi:hypothetical protein
MNTEYSITDLGLEVVQHPITHVRIHRTDCQWLVEYRRKPKWFVDGYWWFNDGKYVEYNEAMARAELLKARGYYTYTRYKSEKFEVE